MSILKWRVIILKTTQPLFSFSVFPLHVFISPNICDVSHTHCKHTISKIWNKHFQKRNCARKSQIRNTYMRFASVHALFSNLHKSQFWPYSSRQQDGFVYSACKYLAISRIYCTWERASRGRSSWGSPPWRSRRVWEPLQWGDTAERSLAPRYTQCRGPLGGNWTGQTWIYKRMFCTIYAVYSQASLSLWLMLWGVGRRLTNK